MTTNQQHSPIDHSNQKTAIQHKILTNKQVVNSRNEKIQSFNRVESQQVMVENNKRIQRIQSYPSSYQLEEQTPKHRIPHQIFLSQYQRKLTSRSFKPSQLQPFPAQAIHKLFPFALNPSQLISVTPTSRLYRCQLSQGMGEEEILENLVMAKTELEGVGNSECNRNQVTDQTFQIVYYDALAGLFKEKHVADESMLHDVASQFKCKMIKSADLSVSEVNFMHDYIKKLMFFYQHRDNVHSQNLFSSQIVKEEKQRLKLFFFKISNSKGFQAESLNSILNCLEQSEQLSEERKQLQMKIDPTFQKIDVQLVISTILSQLNNQNWQTRQMAVDTIQKILHRNSDAMTVTHIQALKNIMISTNKVSKKFALRLVKRWLIKLLEREKNQSRSSGQSPAYGQQHWRMKYLLCQALYNSQQELRHKYTTHSLSKQITNTRYFQPDHHQRTQMQHFIHFYQPVLTALRPYLHSSQPIRPDYLMKLFSKTAISQIKFAYSQSVQLNSKLYVIGKHYERHQVEEMLPFHQQEVMCVVSEYHCGKTLKEVIVNNWKGLENHCILLKLLTKLFWVVVQLQYFQFKLHIPSLENVIVYDSMQHPEINVNLTSFINSAFLFQAGKQEFKAESKEKTSMIRGKRKSTFEELFPVVWTRQIGKAKRPINLDPIKNFLSIMLFMICRRLDHFEGFSTMFSKFKEIIDQKDKNYVQLRQKIKKLQQQKKQKKKSNRNYQHSQGSEQTITITQGQQNSIVKQHKQLDEKRKIFNPLQCLKSILEIHDPIKLNQYFLHLNLFLPPLYSIFLKRYNLPVNNIKRYEMKNYQNSNPYRIGQFENYLGLKNSQLFSLFEQTLTNYNNEGKQSATWRRVFCLLFTQSDEKGIIQSKLLLNLCRIFDYPLEQQDDISLMPPQIYFALKFNIDFCYFQQLYSRQWYNCFETPPQQGSTVYDMQTMCLLKNIKSQVTKVANQKVQKMISIIQRSQKIYIKTEDYLKSLSSDKEEIRLKVGAVIELFRYLKAFEKRVYSSEGNRTYEDEQQDKRTFQYYTNDYFDTFLEEDIDELEETLTLFDSSLGDSV